MTAPPLVNQRDVAEELAPQGDDFTEQGNGAVGGEAHGVGGCRSQVAGCRSLFANIRAKNVGYSTAN